MRFLNRFKVYLSLISSCCCRLESTWLLKRCEKFPDDSDRGGRGGGTAASSNVHSVRNSPQRSKSGKRRVRRCEKGGAALRGAQRHPFKVLRRQRRSSPRFLLPAKSVGGPRRRARLLSARVTQVQLRRAQRHVHDSATMSSSSLYSTFFLCTTSTLMGMYLYGTQDGGGTSPTPRSLMTVCMMAWLGEW